MIILYIYIFYKQCYITTYLNNKCFFKKCNKYNIASYKANNLNNCLKYYAYIKYNNNYIYKYYIIKINKTFLLLLKTIIVAKVNTIAIKKYYSVLNLNITI